MAIRYGRVNQETGITYIPQYSRYPLAVRASAVHTNPSTDRGNVTGDPLADAAVELVWAL
jgi:hypothetical protein